MSDVTSDHVDDAPQIARYTRLYADSEGKSHFEDVDVGLIPTDFAPPADPE